MKLEIKEYLDAPIINSNTKKKFQQKFDNKNTKEENKIAKNLSDVQQNSRETKI